jgi:hypothetical protein
VYLALLETKLYFYSTNDPRISFFVAVSAMLVMRNKNINLFVILMRTVGGDAMLYRIHFHLEC